MNRLLDWLAFVAIVLIITWLLAKVAKWFVVKRVDKVPLFQRAAASGHSVGSSLGLIVSLFIWVCGLILIYQETLDHGDNTPFIIGFGLLAPKIFFAPICFFVGGMIAKILRDIVATTLSTVDFNKWANLGGDEASNSTIGKTISTILFVLLIVPIGIGAFNVLDFPSFTGPVNNMLQILLNAFLSTALLAAGVVLARALKGLVATTDGEGVASALVYWLIIGLFAFVAIKQMNVGGQIVDYVFGTIAIGSAVIFVLAIGIRNRETIARKTSELFK